MKILLLLAAIAGAADMAPPIWEIHPRLICKETFTQDCKVGDWSECDRGTLESVVVIDFIDESVSELFLTRSKDQIVSKLYRKSIGTYADSIIFTSAGHMITIYPETSGAPGNYHAVRQDGFLRSARNRFLSCLPDPARKGQ